jgi:hypothetical protein
MGVQLLASYKYGMNSFGIGPTDSLLNPYIRPPCGSALLRTVTVAAARHGRVYGETGIHSPRRPPREPTPFLK